MPLSELVSKLVAVAVALLLVAALAGCRFVQRPDVELLETAVTERTDEGGRLEMALRLSNPNAVVLPVPMVRYRVTVEDVGTFSVVDDPAVALPPGEEQVVTLAAAFVGNGDAWAGRRFEARGAFSYQPPGQLRVLLSQYRIPLPVTPFVFEGELGEANER